jgi:hypothetical protein
MLLLLLLRRRRRRDVRLNDAVCPGANNTIKYLQQRSGARNGLQATVTSVNETVTSLATVEHLAHAFLFDARRKTISRQPNKCRLFYFGFHRSEREKELFNNCASDARLLIFVPSLKLRITGLE